MRGGRRRDTQEAHPAGGYVVEVRRHYIVHFQVYSTAAITVVIVFVTGNDSHYSEGTSIGQRVAAAGDGVAAIGHDGRIVLHEVLLLLLLLFQGR